MRTVAYILLFVFSWQIVAKGAVLVNFQLNKSFIASMLCEKKAVVENTCKGKCYLKKQLQKHDNKDKDKSLTEKHEVSVFVVQEFLSWTAYSTQFPNEHNTPYALLVPSRTLPPLYQPPRV